MNRPSFVLVALALGLSAWLAPRAARACSCVPPPPPAEALERAAAVFVGEVRGVTKANEVQREVTFAVVRAFKGAEAGEVTLKTSSSSAACGRNFEVGKRYLVYAELGKNELFDHLCTRTALVEQAKHDLDALDAVARGQPPPPAPEPAVEEDDEQEEPPPSGAADEGEKPALDEAPATKPGEPQPPADAPAGHCAAAGPPLSPLALLATLVLVRRRPARRRA